MSARLSCPSCNTAFELDAVPADRRAACPRCGDVFPVKGAAAEASADAPLVLAPVPAVRTGPPVHKCKWSVGRIAAAGLVLALLGFGIGLAVYSQRPPRTRTETPQPAPLTIATATPPAQLAGLGYLPAECNAVFAVQFGPILNYGARLSMYPRDLLGQADVPTTVIDVIESTGLALGQIDHVAGGLFVPSGAEELRVALVLVLKVPLADRDAFLKKLKARPEPGGKSRYAIELGRLPVAPLLTSVSPTVWVFGLSAGDLAAAEKGGFGPGGVQFRGTESEGLRRMIGAVPPTAAIWAAADDDREWADKPLVKALAQSPEGKKWLGALGGARGGAFAISLGEQPRMRLFVRTAETATADRVRAYFQARAAEVGSASFGGGGELAMFDAPLDGPLVRRMLADAGR